MISACWLLQAEDEGRRPPPITSTVLPPAGYPLPGGGGVAAAGGGLSPPPRHGEMSPSARRSTLSRQQSAASTVVQREDEADALSKVGAINAVCSDSDPFVDPSFPPIARSIGAARGDHGEQGLDAATLEHCEWRRPQSLTPHDGWAQIFGGGGRSARQQWSVFKGEPLPSDVEQGRLGNCWFLSALAVLAERPSQLRSIIVTPEYNPAGAYAVRLCVDGLWKVTILDDTFPAFVKPGYVSKLMFSKAKRQQLWVPLIEKALAKLTGCYGAILH